MFTEESNKPCSNSWRKRSKREHWLGDYFCIVKNPNHLFFSVNFFFFCSLLTKLSIQALRLCLRSFNMNLLAPLPPFLHPECRPSAPAAGRRPAVRPDTPWSADGSATPTPRLTGPLFEAQVEISSAFSVNTDMNFETGCVVSPSPDLRQGWQACGPYVKKPRKRSPNPWTLRHSQKRCRPRCASDGYKKWNDQVD